MAFSKQYFQCLAQASQVESGKANTGDQLWKDIKGIIENELIPFVRNYKGVLFYMVRTNKPGQNNSYYSSHWCLFRVDENLELGVKLTISPSEVSLVYDIPRDKYKINKTEKVELDALMAKLPIERIAQSDALELSDDELYARINKYHESNSEAYTNLHEIVSKLERKQDKTKKGTSVQIDNVKNVSESPTAESSEPLNQILFGPPGTGKTYHTIEKAIDILDGKNSRSHEDAKKAFDEYVKTGRIVFTTFHQSMNYEDFMEGIKPHTDEGQVEYNIEDGIFCQIAKKAYVDSIAASTTASSSVRFRDKFDNFISHIAEQLENGDTISFKSKTNKGQTIARIDDDTIRFHAKDGIDRNTVTYARLKKLDDAELNLAETKGDEIKKIIGGCNATYFWTILNEIYKYNKGNKPVSSSKEVQDWTYEDISLEYEKSLEKHRSMKSNQKPYVLIIDEINRGNVANIFGELITLIEEDKRLGNSEAMTCTLPYSKKEFGVPSNLYIIGTMNTADRSVEALDSALRRRFSFVEMMPKPELLEGVTINDVDAISLQDLLTTINKRIEVLKDREHQIGHSYFMKFVGKNPVKAEMLKEVFTDKIIPLLQEYFYGDYEKIRLVLGDGFVTKQTTTVEFAGGSYEDIPEYSYQIVKSPNMAEALVNLMNIKTKKAEPAVQADADEA